MNKAQLPEVASWAGILHETRTAWIYMQCCTVRPPVSFVMSKFLKQNLVKAPFHLVSQQKTRSSAVVFDVALLANPVGSTAKTSLPWHTICILFVHLWELCEQNPKEKHLPPFSFIGSKSTNHSPIEWRRKGYKVTLVAVIGGFRSDVSITRKTDGNFVLF